MTLFAFGGYAESGKDTVADELVERFGYSKTYMSKPLEQALLEIDPWIRNATRKDDGELWQDIRFDTVFRYSSLHRLRGYQRSKEHPEVRRLLQKLGTEVGRNMLGADSWLNAVADEIDSRADWCVTGVRYQNELDRFRYMGGVMVWVDRLDKRPVNSHSSDNSLKPKDFDVILKNHGDLVDLVKATHELHAKLGLHHATLHGFKYIALTDTGRRGVR